MVLHKVFPDVKKVGIYINTNKSNKTYSYCGIRELEKENIMPVNECGVQRVAVIHGFQTLKDNGNIIACKATDDLCGGQRVMKEIKYHQFNKVEVKVGNITVSDCWIPKLCSSLNVWSYILRYVDNAKLCRGFPYDTTTCDSKMKNVASQTWNFGGTEPVQIYRFNRCTGFVSDTNRNLRCLKCNGKKKNSSAIKKQPNDDHSYETGHNTLNIGTKRLHGATCSDTTNPPRKFPKQSNEFACVTENIYSFYTDSEDEVSDVEDELDPTYEPGKKIVKKNPTDDLSHDKIEELIALLPAPLQENEAFLDLLRGQAMNSVKADKHLRRWDTRMIQLCLSVWARSPAAYDQLRDNGMLMLPSPSHLCRYKNSIPQDPGYQEMMFRWMLREANRQNISKEGRQGGIGFDEMSIQSDLQFSTNRPDSHLIGFPDLGPEANSYTVLRKDGDTTIASHILQVVFLGDTGFKFPIAHYPTCEAIAADIYTIVWDAVNRLEEWGFQVNYLCMDGSANNRSFLKMHFPKFNVETSDFTTISPYNPQQTVVILMDPSHGIKKIRNSLIKSGPSRKKHIIHKERPIHWQHWIDAYNWDYSKNSMRVHHRLTHDHLYPDQSAKMRNALADEVLNHDMLHLLEEYKASSGRSDLDGTIEVIKHTSTLVRNFKDQRPIRTTSDERLFQNREVLAWFRDWQNDQRSKKNTFITRECYEDLICMIVAFERIVHFKVKTNPMGFITPNIINSDVVENIFCSQRGICNGSANNPTHLQYKKGLNTIVIGQPVRSRKANAQSKNCVGGALPYKLHVNKSFKKIRL